MANRNNFITGVTELLILSLIEKGDSYIYEIVKSIQDLSDGLLVLPQSTIYTATYKMEDKGYISEYSKKVGRKRTRVYYHLESSGADYLKEIYDNYSQTAQGIARFLDAINDNKGHQDERS
ncbi:MAG: PadR family transcriptional regulator [Lachnospiraceae bacterium]|nr:PadR family transcriptional regulator [Lachnospiraceae bacterium]